MRAVLNTQLFNQRVRGRVAKSKRKVRKMSIRVGFGVALLGMTVQCLLKRPGPLGWLQLGLEIKGGRSAFPEGQTKHECFKNQLVRLL